ncbi:MAG: hypothetical protein ABI165_11680 [Bryobacteraceae bacterium]
MRLLYRILTAGVVATGCVAILGQAQDSAAPKPENPPPAKVEADSFFSGSVTELSSVKITVSKVVLGRPAVKHMFVITHETRIEGKLKNRVRVTVKFVTGDEGDVATVILVRSTQRGK